MKLGNCVKCEKQCKILYKNTTQIRLKQCKQRICFTTMQCRISENFPKGETSRCHWMCSLLKLHEKKKILWKQYIAVIMLEIVKFILHNNTFLSGLPHFSHKVFKGKCRLTGLFSFILYCLYYLILHYDIAIIFIWIFCVIKWIICISIIFELWNKLPGFSITVFLMGIVHFDIQMIWIISMLSEQIILTNQNFPVYIKLLDIIENVNFSFFFLIWVILR